MNDRQRQVQYENGMNRYKERMRQGETVRQAESEKGMSG